MFAQRVPRPLVLKSLGAMIPLPLLEAFLPRTARGAADGLGNAAPPPRMLVYHFGTGMNFREFFPKTAAPSANCRGSSSRSRRCGGG